MTEGTGNPWPIQRVETALPCVLKGGIALHYRSKPGTLQVLVAHQRNVAGVMEELVDEAQIDSH